MQGLSHGVVRVDSENSLTSLTLQDCGQVLQGGELAHWCRVTYICVSKLTIIGSDNVLSPGWLQAIIWTNAGMLLIGPLETNFSEILIEFHTFLFKKMHLKMSSFENDSHFVWALMCYLSESRKWQDELIAVKAWIHELVFAFHVTSRFNELAFVFDEMSRVDNELAFVFCPGLMVVVKLEGTPQLCKTDEVGELCLSAAYTGTGFWGLQGVSNAQFKVSLFCWFITQWSLPLFLLLQVETLLQFFTW